MKSKCCDAPITMAYDNRAANPKLIRRCSKCGKEVIVGGKRANNRP